MKSNKLVNHRAKSFACSIKKFAETSSENQKTVLYEDDIKIIV